MALSEGIPSRSVEFDGTRMFDSAYGEFPKQINMPHTLTMDGFADSKSSLTGLENPVPTDDFSNMHVPERIVVIGGEKMASTREPFPEMRLESLFMGDFAKKNQIDLPTPPSTLTLEEMSPKKDPEYYANARKKVTTDLFDAKNDNESEVARSSRYVHDFVFVITLLIFTYFFYLALIWAWIILVYLIVLMHLWMSSVP